MNRSIDVKTEMRRLATSKPVYAAAGAGVLASQTLRALPARLARLRADQTMTALPARLARLRADGTVSALPARASEYVLTARARAAGGYDKLASRGRLALGADGRPEGQQGRRGKAGPPPTQKG